MKERAHHLRKTHNKSNKTFDLILVGVIILVAAVLRLWKLGQVPFMHDEFSALLRTRFDNFHDFIQQGVMPDSHPIGLLDWSAMVQSQCRVVCGGVLCRQSAHGVLQSVGAALFGGLVLRLADGLVLVQGCFRDENDDKGLCWLRAFGLGLFADAVFLHCTGGTYFLDGLVFPAEGASQSLLAQRNRCSIVVCPHPTHLLPTTLCERQHRWLVGCT